MISRENTKNLKINMFCFGSLWTLFILNSKFLLIRVSVGSYRDAPGEVVSHVNISEVNTRDGGLFTCTAHNQIGTASHSARLNVYGKN